MHRYNGVLYNMIFHTLQWLKRCIIHSLCSQRTPHILPNGWGMGCLLWGFSITLSTLWQHCTVLYRIYISTVQPRKYAHSLCLVVFCCGLSMADITHMCIKLYKHYPMSNKVNPPPPPPTHTHTPHTPPPHTPPPHTPTNPHTPNFVGYDK